MSNAISSICSAKGCRASADWLLVWNNPRIHSAAREKRWAACTQHREYLERFLNARGFLRRTEPVAPGPDDPEGPATAG